MQKSHVCTVITEVREELRSRPLCWQSLKFKKQCLLCVRCRNPFPTCMTSNDTHDKVFPIWSSVSYLPKCFLPVKEKKILSDRGTAVPVWQSGSSWWSVSYNPKCFLCDKVLPIWVLSVWQNVSYLAKCFLFDKVFLISESDKMFPIWQTCSSSDFSCMCWRFWEAGLTEMDRSGWLILSASLHFEGAAPTAESLWQGKG